MNSPTTSARTRNTLLRAPRGFGCERCPATSTRTREPFVIAELVEPVRFLHVAVVASLHLTVKRRIAFDPAGSVATLALSVRFDRAQLRGCLAHSSRSCICRTACFRRERRSHRRDDGTSRARSLQL